MKLGVGRIGRGLKCFPGYCDLLLGLIIHQGISRRNFLRELEMIMRRNGGNGPRKPRCESEEGRETLGIQFHVG